MTSRQAELLLMLIEECAEVSHATTKTLRHGVVSFHPDNPEKTNIRRLNEEIVDLYTILAMLAAELVIQLPTQEQVTETAQRKQQWMHNKSN
jgi:NTP pyrophosphatase (non-canonical NTP hydrolase)